MTNKPTMVELLQFVIFRNGFIGIPFRYSRFVSARLFGNTNGIAIVSVTSTNVLYGCKSLPQIVNVTICGVPLATPTISGMTSLCAGASSSYSSPSVVGVSYI